MASISKTSIWFQNTGNSSTDTFKILDYMKFCMDHNMVRWRI